MMEIADASQREFNAPSLKHRGAGLFFKDLFLGNELDPANNYYFVLARQKSFFSPVHRHNFDQFRYPTVGDISILPGVNVRQGELCYHPEGVHYGPQDDGDELKEILVLQFGGASGQGFLSHSKIAESQKRLAELGRIDGGKYYRRKEDGDGEEQPIDAFQALWEDQMGRKLVYPQGRYDRIIKMQPEAYSWVKVKGQSNISRKLLGLFTERETRAEMIKIEKGTWNIASEEATQLFYVLSGEGEADGQPIKAGWAGRLQRDKAALVTSDTNLHILRFVLPIIQPDEVGME